MTPAEFITRWKDSGGAELANSQSFLKELCALLSVPEPEPTRPSEDENRYVFEKAVSFNNGDGTTSPGRVDLYRAGCFVLESKQGVERKEAEQAEALATVTRQRRQRAGTAQRGTPVWEQAMERARQQAKRYAEALPDEWPPLLIVADIGHCFDIYADFTQSGKNYVPFPDPQSYRIPLDDLADDEVREKLRAMWLDPPALDPSRRTAKITREVAQRLAKLAKSLEPAHGPELVAQFLMRCLFTMFAEDVEIGGLQRGDFTRFLESRRGRLDTFVPMLQQLWQEMDTGGFSVILEGQLKQFNGGLFEDHTALPVTEDQLEMLIEAAEAEWNDVEPAIFGTLLERALDPVERHKLGAHYTPRAYVERLVMPTIIEPLRDQWDTVYATAVSLYENGKAAEAVKTVRRFHEQLCETRVLDPACGSGNFLYVSLELMKRLEGEVLKALRDFGDRQQVLLTIDPHQFLGIEVNPRAAAITDLVLWIGYLQWHFRTRGDDELREPIIRNFHNIECRDAVLAWDRVEPVDDDEGHPVTRWDGRTTKPHPVTGEEVPDETARVQELRYINPRKAEWPTADYVVGNPPFVANRNFRHDLGDGYTDALANAYPEIRTAVDFVLFFWQRASEIVAGQSAKRGGLITTNSIRMQQNEAVVIDAVKHGIELLFAIPDHPWPGDPNNAKVRISMTVFCAASEAAGQRQVWIAPDHDQPAKNRASLGQLTNADFTKFLRDVIPTDLSHEIDISSLEELKCHDGLSHAGLKPYATTLVVAEEKARDLFDDHEAFSRHARRYRNGQDVARVPRTVRVLDFFGCTEDFIRDTYPKAYQYLLDYTKPERAEERNKRLTREFWLFEANRPELRAALADLSRYIVTGENWKTRYFVFLDAEILPDQKLRVYASDDAFCLGVFSSRVHSVFAGRAHGRHGVANTPVYNTRCCTYFPFPLCGAETTERIRKLGEQLDAHRKRQQAAHGDLTMTGMYNVLEKLRAGEELTQKDKNIHEKGLVSVLKQIHDDLDTAVFDAYGWPNDLDGEAILQKLVDLNHQRAAEESQGKIRWLRPDFQNPDGQQETQGELIDTTSKKAAAATVKPAAKVQWPTSLPDRVTAVRTALSQQAGPADVATISHSFKGGRNRAAAVEELLETLVAVGQARRTDDGRFVA